MLHYQVVRTLPGGATLNNKMNNTVHYRHVRHTLAFMCTKNHLLTFSSFLDIWENVEWPRFFGPPCTVPHATVYMSEHVITMRCHCSCSIGSICCGFAVQQIEPMEFEQM